jgi:hypothetical protein
LATLRPKAPLRPSGPTLDLAILPLKQLVVGLVVGVLLVVLGGLVVAGAKLLSVASSSSSSSNRSSSRKRHLGLGGALPASSWAVSRAASIM